MDALHFSIKRVYWSAFARLRELLIPLGITPARADLLRVVAIHEYGIGQSTLTQQLGVSRPTISKMLAAMVEQGWVEKIELEDGTNLIQATAAGLVLIAQVIQRFLLSGTVPLRMAVAWGHGLAKKLRATLYRILNRARRAFLDRAPFLHPWRTESTYVRRKYTIWEAPLRADDVDDTVAEDIALIRERAKQPFACAPPPRSSRAIENINAQRRSDAAPPPPTQERVDREESVTPPATIAVEAWAPLKADPDKADAAHVAPNAAPKTDADVVPKADPETKAPGAAPKTDADVVPKTDPEKKAPGANAKTDTGEDDDIPPELAALWKNLVELSGLRGLSPDEVPKWDEPE